MHQKPGMTYTHPFFLLVSLHRKWPQICSILSHVASQAPAKLSHTKSSRWLSRDHSWFLPGILTISPLTSRSHSKYSLNPRRVSFWAERFPIAADTVAPRAKSLCRHDTEEKRSPLISLVHQQSQLRKARGRSLPAVWTDLAGRCGPEAETHEKSVCFLIDQMDITQTPSRAGAGFNTTP